VVREIIRKTEADPARRPGIHVGGWAGFWHPAERELCL